MSYEVLALKWRPQDFSEIIGQKAVQTTLVNALKNNRLYPVCLFTGPRGTGKTSMARILAKTLRCQQKKNPMSPCGKCEECLLIQKGKSLDVMEIDGASNNGVEAVRELRDTLSYMPSSGSKKIYIIDEVHMLSTSAFNALLKTLEEPPDHVLFIMATTEAQKIPLTVISRCQKFDFHLIPHRLLKSQLEKICKKENISIDDKSLWLITRQAQGSLRDGQSLLDQLITFCDKAITFEKVIENLGLANPMILFKALRSLCERDEKQMVQIINEQRNTGVEARLFLQNLIEGLRDLLILKQNPDNQPHLVNRSHQEIEELKNFSKKISYEDLLFLFDLSLKGERDLNFCHDSQLALEVLLLKLSQAPRLENLVPLNPFLETEEIEKNLSENFPVSSSQKSRTSTKVSANSISKEKKTSSKDFSTIQKNLTVSERLIKDHSVCDSSGPSPSVFPKPSSPQNTDTERSVNQKEKASLATLFSSKTPLAEMEKLWIQFIKFLEPLNPNLAGTVANLSLKGLSGKNFIFHEPSFEYIKTTITQRENFQFLREQLNLFLKSSEQYTIQFQNSSENKPLATLEEAKEKKEIEDLLNQAHRDSFIQTLNQIFEGNIKSVTRPRS